MGKNLGRLEIFLTSPWSCIVSFFIFPFFFFSFFLLSFSSSSFSLTSCHLTKLRSNTRIGKVRLTLALTSYSSTSIYFTCCWTSCPGDYVPWLLCAHCGGDTGCESGWCWRPRVDESSTKWRERDFLYIYIYTRRPTSALSDEEAAVGEKEDSSTSRRRRKCARKKIEELDGDRLICIVSVPSYVP